MLHSGVQRAPGSPCRFCVVQPYTQEALVMPLSPHDARHSLTPGEAVASRGQTQRFCLRRARGATCEWNSDSCPGDTRSNVTAQSAPTCGRASPHYWRPGSRVLDRGGKARPSARKRCALGSVAACRFEANVSRYCREGLDWRPTDARAGTHHTITGRVPWSVRSTLSLRPARH